MKNTSFLLTFFIIIHSLSAINPLFCQENEKIGKYSFSLGTGFGLLNGEALELVYPLSEKINGELLSELTWEMKPVFYAGLNADLGLTDLLSGPGFFSSLSVKAGIPADTGYLIDRDWQSIENSNLTNYSIHDNETNELIWIDLAVGFSFPIKSLYIKPFISGSWMHFYFIGRNGYLKYADDIPKGSGSGIYEPIKNASKVPISGKVITYQQDWLLLAAGLSIGTNIFYPFSFDLSFQISPLTYCAAIDEHKERNVVFKDYTDYTDFNNLGLFLKPGCNISLDVKKIKFSLDVSYRYISETKGPSYRNSSNIGFSKVINKSGAGLSVMDCQFLVKLAF
jgi:outer membrane protease